jgi:hypothetical protein
VYDSYTDLYEKHDKEIERFADLLKSQAKDFYENRKVGGFSISDITHPANGILIDDIVLNTISDLVRIKAYHKVETPTRYKYAAYIGFWWQRSKPFLCKLGNYTEFPELNDDTLDSLFLELCKSVNELFITDVMLSLIKIKPTNGFCADIKKTVAFADIKDSLYYFLKYRHYSAQGLELFLKGLNTCPLGT